VHDKEKESILSGVGSEQKSRSRTPPKRALGITSSSMPSRKSSTSEFGDDRDTQQLQSIPKKYQQSDKPESTSQVRSIEALLELYSFSIFFHYILSF
jgi:hypothetical protein